MRNLLFICLVCVFLVSSCIFFQDIRTGGEPQDVKDKYIPEPENQHGITVEPWISELQIPWSLVFLDEERALVSERPGRIRLITSGELSPSPWYMSDDIHSAGEGGLMGLAVHPNYPDSAYIYAMHTTGSRVSAANIIIRLKDEGRTASFDRVIFEGIPGSLFHNGGRIAFGPDGMLYVTTGENFRPSRAQDMENLGGKTLRLTPLGAVPDDNPFPDSPVYTLGHRNAQGLAWHPENGILFNSEHGPSGEYGLRGHDMVNVIRGGTNYGWPEVIGKTRSSRYADPLIMWKKTTPPGGIAFWEGDLYIATMRSEALIRVSLEFDQDDENNITVTEIERWFKEEGAESGTYGRFRDVVTGPDGALYVTTSNRDGRGQPRDNDDHILRITRNSGE